TVYAAYDARLDRRVALKMLAPDPGSELNAAQGAARLVREAQALARLAHPNVLAVYEASEWQGQVYPALEDVAGQSLRPVVEQPRSWQQVLRAYLDAGQGLAAAHARGLVHRDFKPANVQVGRDGRGRVLDFGIARLTSTTASPRVQASQLPAQESRALLETE